MGSIQDHRGFFDDKLRDAWSRGMTKGEVVYEPSTSVFSNDHGIPFEARYLPCLDKKPSDDRPESPSQDYDMDDNSSSKSSDSRKQSSTPRDPFALPRDNIVYEMKDYTCVLNKFALERGHFLCVTNDWYPQKGTLRSCDVRIMYDLLSSMSSRHYCFFNCGPLAGASQEHRHFQFMTVPDLRSPCWTDQIFLRAPKSQEILSHPNIPALHFLLPILDSKTEALHLIFSRLYQAAQTALGRTDCEMPYNFMMTSDYMLLFPRRNEEWDAHHVGVGGTCLAGQIMVSSKETLEIVKAVGIREILGYVGFPISTASTSPTKDEEIADEAMSMSYESGVTLEDPDVRLAAEVLRDLKSSELSPPPAFLNRVSEYPIVSTAVKAYESSKTSSRGFNYAATTIENIARPVVSRFEPLDEFACRQLDRIEGRGRYTTRHDLESQAQHGKRKSISEKDDIVGEAEARSRANHSRWHSVLSSASSFHLSLSEDSLKSLRYCSDWLHWANGHVHGLLGNLTGRLGPESDANAGLRNMSPEELHTLSQSVLYVKREISETLKKLMGIVSNYAGTALPEPARSRVRGYVLGMPSRWAARQSQTRRTSIDVRRLDANGYPIEKLDEIEELGREYTSVTSLANESLEMLHNVSDIVGRTINSFTRRPPAPAAVVAI